MGRSAEPIKTLTIRSVAAEAIRALGAILDDVKAKGYTDNSRFAIKLALDEAISNAINHGNAGDAAKTVTIEYSVTEERVEVRVTDQGPGFNPDDVPDPTLDENLERPHGRGVMLMRAYMTEVSFNKKGNTVTLVKTRACRLPER